MDGAPVEAPGPQSSVQSADADLAAAGARAAEIARLIQSEQAKLAAHKRTAKRGRPNNAFAKKTAAFEQRIRRLQMNLLPGETVPSTATQRAPGDIAASAHSNAQHHARPAPVPNGRPQQQGGGSSSGGGGDERGGGERGGSGTADDDGDDDDDEDPAFRNFYRVSPAQKHFNTSVMESYLATRTLSRKTKFVDPRDLIASNCDPAVIGVGRCHIFAPHSQAGLPMPPCPRCEWISVDEGEVKQRGSCPARRVFAEECDEWVAGVQLTCGRCQKEKEKAQEEVARLEEDEHSTEEEMREAKAAVRAATYVYRSYNSASMKLYAQRYRWCATARPILAPTPALALSSSTWASCTLTTTFAR